jgi:5-formyltetrahydrofolate cyclo-ligase
MGTDVRAEADGKILAAVKSVPEYLAAGVVFCYVSARGEPDTRAIIEDMLARGKRVCVPLCLSMGVMQAREISSPGDLQPGKYDIPEPKPACEVVTGGEIGLNIVPCVCSDADGYRLGYGGGFYDRWLEDRGAPALVLCYESMVVPSVPRERHDQRADILVTDGRISVYEFATKA